MKKLMIVTLSLLALIVLVSACGGDDTTATIGAALRVSVSPSAIPADGISFARITADGRGADGKTMKDGEQIIFTTLSEYGKFSNGQTKIEATFNAGKAEVLFIAGTEPGYGFVGGEVKSLGLKSAAQITLISAHDLSKAYGETDAGSSGN